MAGEIMQEISGKVKPHLPSAPARAKLGTVVVGTVAGDIHDIGKDIVAMMLDIAGFDVVDLGVDVSVEKFVDTVRERKALIVAMSCLLTNAFESMKRTVAALDEAGSARPGQGHGRRRTDHGAGRARTLAPTAGARTPWRPSSWPRRGSGVTEVFTEDWDKLTPG